MKIEVLGSSGAELPGYNASAFLVDRRVLLDAGTIGTSLNEARQWEIRDILITHAHLDHIKAIPFLADNIIITRKKHSVTLFGTRDTLNTLSAHLLNDRLWPDFTKISASIEPVLKLRPITPGKPFRVNGYTVAAYPVSHTVPAVGYIMRDSGDRTLLYTGDTGPTERIWRTANKINTAIIEVSFPDGMEDLAIKTGHLTPRLLGDELMKMRMRPDRVLITHIKPQYLRQISKELDALKRNLRTRLEIIHDGKSYKV